MKILVVNAGSSSLKYQLLNVENNEVLAKGNCEKVGSPDSWHKYGLEGQYKDTVPMPNHDAALKAALDSLISGPAACISGLEEIAAAGHRIVSGGSYFSESVFVDDDVIEKIELCSELAPLHNPGAVMGIRACMDVMPDIPQVTVFDTAFFQSIPPQAYMYALPLDLTEKYKIRKYGAHGTSHRYVAGRAAALLGKDVADLKLITCHLGNGASISAIRYGVALDTSMGFTPLDGLMMGTRCGSIDPAIVTYVMEKEGLSPAEMDSLMNRQSGLLGVSGVSNDLRDVLDKANEGDERAILAYDMYAYTIRKYIGQYLALLGGADAVVLTAGVGENCVNMRSVIFDGFQELGIILDPELNQLHGFERIISDPRSRTKIVVVPTNEEYMIARDVYTLVTGETLPVAKYREEEGGYASKPMTKLPSPEGPIYSER